MKFSMLSVRGMADCPIYNTGELEHIAYLHDGIIEGDQIEVASFSFESVAYFTGLVTASNNAGSNSARSHIANGSI